MVFLSLEGERNAQNHHGYLGHDNVACCSLCFMHHKHLLHQRQVHDLHHVLQWVVLQYHLLLMFHVKHLYAMSKLVAGNDQ